MSKQEIAEMRDTATDALLKSAMGEWREGDESFYARKLAVMLGRALDEIERLIDDG